MLTTLPPRNTPLHAPRSMPCRRRCVRSDTAWCRRRYGIASRSRTETAALRPARVSLRSCWRRGRTPPGAPADRAPSIASHRDVAARFARAPAGPGGRAAPESPGTTKITSARTWRPSSHSTPSCTMRSNIGNRSRTPPSRAARIGGVSGRPVTRTTLNGGAPRSDRPARRESPPRDRVWGVNSRCATAGVDAGPTSSR